MNKEAEIREQETADPAIQKYRQYLIDLWKQNWMLIAAWLAGGLGLMSLFWIFQQPADIAWIFILLSGMVLGIYLGFYLRRLHTVRHLLLSDSFSFDQYPAALQSVAQKMEELDQKNQSLFMQMKQERKELEDYFSLWAHQIKLPLAAMNLQLQLPDPNLADIASCEKRIESCVDQAMAYIRLEGSDYRIRLINPEEIVRPVLRQNSSSFIARSISVDCSFDGRPVCTDRKWLSFLIEQLLSNALKYSGDKTTIQIEAAGNTLKILDEGCGIAPEDLPRIFEKGFTGKNGHENTSASSGLGLYLCDQICRRLGCKLSVSNRSSAQNPNLQGVEAKITFPDSLNFKD